jgi:hypothetical protein
MKMIKASIDRDSNGKLPSYAWPGGYPIFYLTQDDAVLCPQCANGENGSDTLVQDDPQWNVTAHDINWEDPDMTCEHCNRRIESAYAEDDAGNAPKGTV